MSDSDSDVDPRLAELYAAISDVCDDSPLTVHTSARRVGNRAYVTAKVKFEPDEQSEWDDVDDDGDGDDSGFLFEPGGGGDGP